MAVFVEFFLLCVVNMSSHGGKRSNSGRQKTATIWTDGFFITTGDNMTKCTAETEGVPCPYLKAERFSSNLVYHLSTAHAKDGVYARYLAIEKAKNESKKKTKTECYVRVCYINIVMLRQCVFWLFPINFCNFYGLY